MLCVCCVRGPVTKSVGGKVWTALLLLEKGEGQGFQSTDRVYTRGANHVDFPSTSLFSCNLAHRAVILFNPIPHPPPAASWYLPALPYIYQGVSSAPLPDEEADKPPATDNTSKTASSSCSSSFKLPQIRSQGLEEVSSTRTYDLERLSDNRFGREFAGVGDFRAARRGTTDAGSTLLGDSSAILDGNVFSEVTVAGWERGVRVSPEVKCGKRKPQQYLQLVLAPLHAVFIATYCMLE